MRETDKFIFFWGDYMSHWYPCEFIIKGMTFNCVEQWLMWNKAKLYGDEENMEFIMETADPKIHIAIGKNIRGVCENAEKWDNIKEDIAFIGNYAKFTYTDELKVKLLGTGDKIIVSANFNNYVWGVGLTEHDPLINEQKTWKGRNLLGIVLMRVRELLIISDNNDEILNAYKEYRKLPRAELSGPNRSAVIYKNKWCKFTSQSTTHPQPHRHFTYDEFKIRLKTDKLLQATFKINKSK